MEGITVEFNQLRKLVHRLKHQCDHVEDDVKSQFTEFLEVRGAATIQEILYTRTKNAY